MPKLVDLNSQKQMIADAAIRLIEKGGVENVRLRDVARAGKVTVGTVTHHFDSKDAVLAAALAEVVRRTLARVDMPFKAGKANDITAYVRRVCGYLPIDDESRGEWRIWLAFWGRAVTDDQLRLMNRDYFDAFVERIAERLQTLQGAPQDPELARDTADALVAAIDGIATRATLNPETWPAKRQVAALTALLRPLLESYCGK
ncbi:TetR family transcriptional regulator [Sneathiella chungangensis]|uniref:TetR family transcriptional regulator n=1 Tax=Sneathiella chungangensis TaxID=1418234 RepID=A0A845MG97_9PROT|nr:TetR/AcrR family transcriptional regulator [Sneathiella chungangensis]MZR22277.1 TetR family transcriptional regulator [Sneathiella chungangensis]